MIETRGEAGDTEDRRTIYRAQRSGHAEAAVTYTFESSLNLLLWVPDAIAGIVAASFTDGVDRYLDRLGEHRPTIFDVDP